MSIHSSLKSNILASRLSMGVYGRITYEFACQRGRAFKEAHLHSTLSEILSSQFDPRSHMTFTDDYVEAIQRRGHKNERGSKRKVDIVTRKWDKRLLNNERVDSQISVCVEAKWSGSTHASGESILMDLARLSVVKRNNSEIQCFFVLAGPKDPMDQLIGSDTLKVNDPARGGGGALALPSSPSPISPTYFLRDSGDNRRSPGPALMKKIEKKLPQYPDQIQTKLHTPRTEHDSRWRVYVWEVL